MTAIENDNAEIIRTKYEICDITGFKQRAGKLMTKWNGHAVRPDSFEAIHPQELVRSRPENALRGSPSPEPDNAFVGTVLAEDL